MIEWLSNIIITFHPFDFKPFGYPIFCSLDDKTFQNSFETTKTGMFHLILFFVLLAEVLLFIFLFSKSKLWMSIAFAFFFGFLFFSWFTREMNCCVTMTGSIYGLPIRDHAQIALQWLTSEWDGAKAAFLSLFLLHLNRFIIYKKQERFYTDIINTIK